MPKATNNQQRDKIKESRGSRDNSTKRPSRNGRGKRKPNFKHQENDVTTSNSITSLANDPSWYNVYPDLVDSTARISTGYPIGINYDITGLSDKKWIFINDIHTMRLFYIHGVGLTENDRDPINLAATKLYSFVRHANSGHSNYERTDLMLYFLSIIEAYNLIGNAIRAYGVINTFNNMNRSMPAHVIEAMGWDYDDLIGDAPKLRTLINNAIARVNSLYVPTELNVVKRWWWLNTTMFTDSAGPKAMNYVFTPSIYRVWEEMDSDNGGYLKAVELDEKLTITTWKRAINDVLNRILDSEDIGIMSGDILKAYGDKVFTLSMIPEDYSTPFVYSEEVLMQITNTHLLGRKVEGLDITQEANDNLNSGLRYNPFVTVDQEKEADVEYVNVMLSTPVLSFPMDNPDNATVMVASRNYSWGDDINFAEHKLTIACGSEIFTQEKIYRNTQTYALNPSYMMIDDDAYLVAVHSRFDHGPLVKCFSRSGSVVFIGGSHFENVVPVGESTMYRMHDTALLSLFTALV